MTYKNFYRELLSSPPSFTLINARDINIQDNGRTLNQNLQVSADFSSIDDVQRNVNKVFAHASILVVL